MTGGWGGCLLHTTKGVGGWGLAAAAQYGGGGLVAVERCRWRGGRCRGEVFEQHHNEDTGEEGWGGEVGGVGGGEFAPRGVEGDTRKGEEKIETDHSD